MTSGGHTKGHTELPWRRSDSQTSMYGSEIVANTKVKSKRVVCRLGGPDREENTDLILTAVNTYPAVAELVKALERAKKLVRLVTVRQAIDSGDDAIEAAGLNPWAMNEGLAEGSERIDAYFIDSALTRFREAQAGGGA